MSEDPPDPRRGCILALGHWLAFGASIPVLVCLLGGFVGAWLVAVHGLDPGLASPEGQKELMTPGFVGATSILQILLMAGIGATLSALLPRSEDEGLATHVARAHAIRASHPAWVVCGAIATLTVGMFPGWVASRLMELPMLEGFAESMGLIGETLAQTDHPGWILMALAVGLFAPVFEELIFRGYLWRAAELALPPVGVWLLTSVAFAGFHGNPIHIAAVLPIGLLFGWLRLQSGSIWPSMLAHAVNNGLALGITLWAGQESEAPLGWALAGFACTLALVTGAHLWARAGILPRTTAP